MGEQVTQGLKRKKNKGINLLLIYYVHRRELI